MQFDRGPEHSGQLMMAACIWSLTSSGQPTSSHFTSADGDAFFVWYEMKAAVLLFASYEPWSPHSMHSEWWAKVHSITGGVNGGRPWSPTLYTTRREFD